MIIVPKSICLPGERWKYIKNFENLYAISTHGRVWSCPRFILRAGYSQKVLIGGCIRRPRIAGLSGHCQITLFKKTKRYLFGVHRLVAETFVKGRKSDHILVMHKDDDPTNNNYKNLKWGTHQDNEDDKCSKGRQARGESQGSSKLTANDVRKIRKLYASGMSSRKLRIQFDMCKTSIFKIVNNILWKHV